MEDMPSSPFQHSSPYRSPASSGQHSPPPPLSPVSPHLSPSSESSSFSSDCSDKDVHQRKRKVCRTTSQRRLKKCLERRGNGQHLDEEREREQTGEEWRNIESYDTESSMSSSSSADTSNTSTSSSFVSSDNTESAESSSTDSESDNNDSVIEHEPLYDGANLSNIEALLNVLKLYVKMGWSKKSLDLNLKLIKGLLPQPNELPSTSSSAIQLLENLTSSCCEEEYLCCQTCGQLADECDHTDNLLKFYSFPVEKQIKHMFEQRHLAAAVEFYKASKADSYLSDIVDGTEYRKIKEDLQNSYDLILLWNTDGAEMSTSSKQEMWPILCTICEVPPRLRSSFLVVAGVYVGEKKPNMNMYLKPFADSLIKLWQYGLSWVHPVSKLQIQSKVVAPVLSADAPAKALVNCCMNFNSKFGCNICEQKTKKIPLSAEEIEFNLTAPNRKKKRRKRRFVFQEEDAVLRTGPRVELYAEMAERSGKPRRGINGPATVSSIPFLDRANFIAAEYLHVVLLGCVKYLLNIMMSTRGRWYIGDKLDEMDLFIASVKVPSFVKRLPRGFKYFKHWKGSELRAFLLYYSLPLFKDYLPEEYFQHWLLLVAGINILLKDSITEVELNAAEILLRSFVRDVGDLYGNITYTYNMHNLLHLPLLVQRWGPLWATSAFVFESCNGFISRHVHGTKHLGKELINYIKISQSVSVLDNIVNTNSLELKTVVRSSIPLGKEVHSEFLTVEEQAFLLPSHIVYRRAKLYDGDVYTCKSYDAKKRRADSFIQFKAENGELTYGQIIYFLSDNDSLCCLVKVMTVSHVDLFCHTESRFVLRYLIPVYESEQMVVIPVHKITFKVLKIGRYLGIAPNYYEINL